jgi:hypothetical protein
VCARCRLSGSKCAAGLPRGPPAAVPFGSICPTCAQSETSARTHPRKRTRGVDAWCMQRLRGASPSATARACSPTHRCRPPPHSPRAAAPRRSVVATTVPR